MRRKEETDRQTIRQRQIDRGSEERHEETGQVGKEKMWESGDGAVNGEGGGTQTDGKERR